MTTNNKIKCSFCKKERSKGEVDYIHLFFDKNKLCNGYEIAVSPEYLRGKVNFVCCKYCLKSFFDLFNVDIEDKELALDERYPYLFKVLK